MDTYWIQCIFCGLLLLNHAACGEFVVEAHLTLSRSYAEIGSSTSMHCVHNVPDKILYKVTWLKSDMGKFYQYINGRSPPYRNFTLPGAEIDFLHSNKTHATIRKVNFPAEGQYYCEVSTDTPIFTKESDETFLHILLPQNEPPSVQLNARRFYVGDTLVANCTTAKARPAPHITWLINGFKVDQQYSKALAPPEHGKNGHRSKSHRPISGNGNSNALDETRTNRPPYDSNNGNHLGSDDSISYSGNVYNRNGNNNNNNRNHHVNHLDTASSPSSSLGGGNVIHPPATYSEYGEERYENKRKHRPSRTGHQHKYRRHAKGEQSNRNLYPATATGSQLTIELTEEHMDPDGRAEIGCAATIPDEVISDEEYADIKTKMAHIELRPAEATSPLPPMSGMAALGNAASSCRRPAAASTWALLVPTILLTATTMVGAYRRLSTSNA